MTLEGSMLTGKVLYTYKAHFTELLHEEQTESTTDSVVDTDSQCQSQFIKIMHFHCIFG